MLMNRPNVLKDLDKIKYNMFKIQQLSTRLTEHNFIHNLNSPVARELFQDRGARSKAPKPSTRNTVLR